MNILQVSGLKVSYGGIAAVKGIDFDIKPGANRRQWRW